MSASSILLLLSSEVARGVAQCLAAAGVGRLLRDFYLCGRSPAGGTLAAEFEYLLQ